MTRVGAFFVVHLTLVLSPLTFLQPLPALTATLSSIVIVLPERVITTLFCLPLAALYWTFVAEVTEATPLVAASAGEATVPTAAMVDRATQAAARPGDSGHGDPSKILIGDGTVPFHHQRRKARSMRREFLRRSA
nr:hypothetical protein GCM10020092_007170 [Actinoplanes digitatis]